MMRMSPVAAMILVLLLGACAQADGTAAGGSEGAGAPNDSYNAALTECRTRAAITVSPAAGRGMAGYESYDRAVAQCLRNIRKSR
jgi:hypothetical protein